MELSASSRFSWTDLIFRPGSLIGLGGFLIIAGCIVAYAWSNHSVDLIANPEMVSSGGHSIKLMVWMVGGVAMLMFGALLTFLDFQRR